MDQHEYFSEPDSIDSDEERLEKIKKFTLGDYLRCAKTRKILEDQHLEKFLETAEKDIIELYGEIKQHCKETMSSALKFDETNRGTALIAGLTYKYIYKEYDLEIFNQSPELARPLIAEEEKKKNKR